MRCFILCALVATVFSSEDHERQDNGRVYYMRSMRRHLHADGGVVNAEVTANAEAVLTHIADGEAEADAQVRVAQNGTPNAQGSQPGGKSLVDYLYTFASMRVKRHSSLHSRMFGWRGLTNGATKDGCFPGLRVWSKVSSGIGGGPDGVTRFPGVLPWQWRHVRQATMEVRPDSSIDSFAKLTAADIILKNVTWLSGGATVTDCKAGNDKAPSRRGDICFGEKCHVSAYFFNYSSHDRDLAGLSGVNLHGHDLETYWRFSLDTMSKYPLQIAKQLAAKDGYRIVGLVRVESRLGLGIDKDQLMLYQKNDASLACTLAIEGSDKFKDGPEDWASNFNVRQVRFCGWKRTHKGLVGEFRNIAKSTQYQQKIKAILPKCGKLTVVGHSKGGGLAQLFAACANSDRGNLETQDKDNDFALVDFAKATTPEQLPEVPLEW